MAGRSTAGFFPLTHDNAAWRNLPAPDPYAVNVAALGFGPQSV